LDARQQNRTAHGPTGQGYVAPIVLGVEFHFKPPFAQIVMYLPERPISRSAALIQSKISGRNPIGRSGTHMSKIAWRTGYMRWLSAASWILKRDSARSRPTGKPLTKNTSTLPYLQPPSPWLRQSGREWIGAARFAWRSRGCSRILCNPSLGKHELEEKYFRPGQHRTG
jgi:hypothetical protein